ncbi:MAG: phosphate ABC transporter, permease protein PstA, partial [Thermoproteota archaeon]|nr:phosphate ABC transporter, permease protein PstA [Thermoproteota archaeon]
MNKENNDYKSVIQKHINNNSAKRRRVNNLMTCLLFSFVVIAIIPLASILIEVFKNGASALSFEFLTQTPGSIGSPGGGVGPAVQGTLLVVGLAALIGAPVGILVGVYLSEYSSSSKGFAYFLRLFNDVLTGIPSVV